MSENLNTVTLEGSEAKKSPLDFLKKVFKRRSSLDARKARSGYLFVLPFILGIILIYLPILIDSVWFSFNNIKTEMVNGNLVISCDLPAYTALLLFADK